MNDSSTTLMEITGQESGIIIHEDGNTIVCNWSSIEGIPLLDLLGINFLGIGQELTLLSSEEIAIKEFLDEHVKEIAYDRNDDINNIKDSDVGTLYLVAVDSGYMKVKVITHPDWS